MAYLSKQLRDAIDKRLAPGQSVDEFLGLLLGIEIKKAPKSNVANVGSIPSKFSLIKTLGVNETVLFPYELDSRGWPDRNKMYNLNHGINAAKRRYRIKCVVIPTGAGLTVKRIA